MDKPNWQDIERCPIWKEFGIIVCESCDTKEQCWGEGINLDKVLGSCDNIDSEKALKRILEAISGGAMK
jgi:hypothetical protein